MKCREKGKPHPELDGERLMKAGSSPCHLQQRDVGAEDSPSSHPALEGPGPEWRGASTDGLEDVAAASLQV